MSTAPVQPASPPVEPDAEIDPFRAHMHRMWSTVARSWDEHADHVDERGAVVAERLLDLARPGPGARVLELACGPGGTGLAAAERVLPDGEVVLSDISVEMTAIAGARAAARGWRHVTTRVLDLEDIAEPADSFDVVLCRDGLMFVPDPARSAREIHRVLRPGGSLAVAVWGSRDDNPWLGVVFDVVGEVMGTPMPPQGVPGPFALGAPGDLSEVLGAGGFTDVTVTDVPVPLRAPSFEDWWARTSALAGPLASVLAAQGAELADEVVAAARRAVVPYETADGLHFPGVAVLGSAHAST